MQRTILLVILTIGIVALTAAACAATDTPPSSPPQPTAQHPKTVAPIKNTNGAAKSITPTNSAPQPAANTVITTTRSIRLTPFAITLPSPWPVEHFSAAAWQSQLQRQQEDKPTLAHYFRILRAVETVETGVVLTWPTASTTELTMLAVVAPVADLSLQTYLTEATTELEQSRLTVGSGLRLTSAQIRYNLHEAHLPVAMLSFTVPQSGPPGGPSQPEQRVQGNQAAMLDPAGSHLLLLTFISRDPMPDLAEKLMEAIIATVAIP